MGEHTHMRKAGRGGVEGREKRRGGRRGGGRGEWADCEEEGPPLWQREEGVSDVGAPLPELVPQPLLQLLHAQVHYRCHGNNDRQTTAGKSNTYTPPQIATYMYKKN